MKEFKIGNKFVGENHPVYIIAEAGCNHDGKLEQGFRLIEEALLFFRVSQEVSEGQKFLHLGVEAEKIAKEERALRELSALQKESRVFMEIEEGTKLSRTRMFARFLRLPRLIKVFPFYEKPIKHEIKIVEKDVKKEARTIKRDIRKIERKLKS